MFSQFPLLEVRVWFVSLLTAYAELLRIDGASARGKSPRGTWRK